MALGLFSRPAELRTTRNVIIWWEIRRPIYNLVVGIAGLVSCVTAVVMGMLVESHGGVAIFPNPPIFAIAAVLLYGLMANICYTGGWICELIACKWWPQEADAFGRLSFIFGLIGSVIVSLLPALGVIVLSIPQMFAHHASTP